MRTRPNFRLSSVFLRGLAVLLCPLLLAGCSVSDALDSSAAGTPDNAPPESEYSAWMPLPLDEDLPAAAVPSVDSDAQSAAPSADTAAPPANTTTDKTFPLTVSVQRAETIISQQEWDTLLRPHALRSYYRFAVQPVAWQDADTFGTPELREQFLQAVPDVDSHALRFVQGAYCEDETDTLPAVLAVLYQPDAACWHLLWQRPSIGLRYLTSTSSLPDCQLLQYPGFSHLLVTAGDSSTLYGMGKSRLKPLYSDTAVDVTDGVFVVSQPQGQPRCSFWCPYSGQYLDVGSYLLSGQALQQLLEEAPALLQQPVLADWIAVQSWPAETAADCLQRTAAARLFGGEYLYLQLTAETPQQKSSVQAAFHWQEEAGWVPLAKKNWPRVFTDVAPDSATAADVRLADARLRATAQPIEPDALQLDLLTADNAPALRARYRNLYYSYSSRHPCYVRVSGGENKDARRYDLVYTGQQTPLAGDYEFVGCSYTADGLPDPAGETLYISSVIAGGRAVVGAADDPAAVGNADDQKRRRRPAVYPCGSAAAVCAGQPAAGYHPLSVRPLHAGV